MTRQPPKPVHRVGSEVRRPPAEPYLRLRTMAAAGEMNPRHLDHLICHQVKDLKQPAFARVGSVFVNKSVRTGNVGLHVKKPAELSLPALKNP